MKHLNILRQHDIMIEDKSVNDTDTAVIDGGQIIRKSKFPCRNVSDQQALDCIAEVFAYYQSRDQDIPYQADFEKKYCEEFCEYHGGGYADAVSSGSIAVYLALQLLSLPSKSKVAISPVTDPGAISALIFADLVPVIVDTAAQSFNIDSHQLSLTLNRHQNIKALLVTHVGGLPVDMEAVMQVAKSNRIEVVEDCSQAHGASINGRKVGTFGRSAAFSTMFTKNHTTGSSGGIVLCQTEKDYWKIRSLADRQKPFSDPNFNPKDPGCFLGPAMNFNSNEIACALGSLSLKKLEWTIAQRFERVMALKKFIQKSVLFVPVEPKQGHIASYFFCTLLISSTLNDKHVEMLKKALEAEQTSINSNYRYIASEWPWLTKEFPNMESASNAIEMRNRSINILFHEKYKDADIKDIAEALLRAERHVLAKL